MPAAPSTASRTVTGVQPRLRARRAFTFIETLVVIFLVGVLSAIAISSFAGGDQLSEDRVAQANADAALDAVATASVLDESPTADPSRLAQEVPELTFLPVGEESEAVGEVSVGTSGRYSFAVATLASDGSCFMARVSFAAEPSEQSRLYAVRLPGSTLACNATQALLLTPLPTQPGKGTSWRNPIVL